MVRLDPQFRYSWRDGSALDVPDDADATAAAFERFAPGAGDQWRAFDANGRTHLGRRGADVLRRPDVESEVARCSGWSRRATCSTSTRSGRCDAPARDTFDDDHLRQWAGRYATYSGSSPARAPATLACIPHIESRFGCWYPMGGLGALRDAIEQVARDVGVEIRTSHRGRCRSRRHRTRSPASSSTTGASSTRRSWWRTSTPPPLRRPAPRRQGREAGAQGEAFDERVRAVHRRARPDRRASATTTSGSPTTRTRSSGPSTPATSPTTRRSTGACRRPPIPTPGTRRATRTGSCSSTRRPASTSTPSATGDLVLDRLATHGVDLRRPHALLRAHDPDATSSTTYRSPGGAIYGTSSNGKRAAFVRPANRGAHDRAVPRRRIEPSGRRPPAGHHQRPDRRRHDHRATCDPMTASARAAAAGPSARRRDALRSRRRGGDQPARRSPLGPTRARRRRRRRRSGAVDQRGDPGARRGRADRTAPRRRSSRRARRRAR